MEPVGRYPRIGRAVPGFGREDLRDVIHQNYRIVYRVLADRIDVLAVFEGHRQFPKGIGGGE